MTSVVNYLVMMKNLKIDEGFPKRVLKTSLILTGLIILVSISQWPLEVTTGFIIGAGISLILFIILCGSVKYLLHPDSKREKLFFGIAFIFKFFALLIALFLTFKYLSFSYLAFLIGIGLVQLVIFLKLVGIVMVNYMNRTSQSGAQG